MHRIHNSPFRGYQLLTSRVQVRPCWLHPAAPTLCLHSGRPLQVLPRGALPA